MRKTWRSTNLIHFILFFLFLQFQAKAQQTLTQINGWNAWVHLPADYNTTTNKYPTIIFFPGLGEVGTNANAAIANGPGAHITQGWDGNVNIDGNTVQFIVISLQPSSAFPSEANINVRLQTIKSSYRVDPDKLYLTGLSHGGWCSSTFVSGDAYGGPYNYASQIAAVVTVEGMKPDDNSPYPDLFDNFALSGGRYLGFEQVNDGRDTRSVVGRMNAAVPNSAIYVSTNFGNGGHCCWSNFYGGGGTQPGIFLLGGTMQNIYQWLARQSRGNTSNTPPICSAGPDVTITLPQNSVVLNGSGSDPDGTVISFKWNQISGPGASIMSNQSLPTLTVTNLIEGVYQFAITVLDNTTAASSDTVSVIVKPNPATTVCNSNTPVTHYLNNTGPGEIYRPNGSAWKGGDTVKIMGTNYSVIEFYNIAGDRCNPIVIMPMTRVSTPAFRIKGNSRYLKIWGGPTPYGIKVTGGSLAITLSHHIEADNIECYGGSTGVYCKQDVVYADTMTWHPNYRMTKFTFKNMWIHDVDGEGMYIGITAPNGLTVTSTYSGLDTVIVPVRLDSVEVSNCIVERTAWDGIQLSNTRNGNKIFNNTVRNFGLLNISTQQAGILLGSNCAGDVYGNTIVNGTGNGLQVFGYGTINVYNNTLDSCGRNGATNSNGTQGLQAIYASDYLISTDFNARQKMNVYNNIINRPMSAAGIFITDYANNSLPSSILNNQFCIPGAPGNWQSIYIKANVPGSILTNNLLSCAAVNFPPTANAGANITITLPVNQTILTGAGIDTDGTVASYQWKQVAGPIGAILLTPALPVTNVTSLLQGTYQFELSVTDNLGAIGRDTVIVIVNAAANQLPIANAGNDISITLPLNSATLSGIGTDNDGTVVSYQWSKIAGPAAGSLANANTPVATASGLTTGTYSFQLIVTDNRGGVGKDTMRVIVNPAPNQAPTVNAGSDISVTLPTNTAYLTGIATDADGTISSYAWTKVSGPAGGNITSPSTSATTITSLLAGVYYYQLTVVDNAGGIGRDSVKITVNPAPNQPPTAYAGTDTSITLPTNTVSLTGLGTDVDGTISSYAWAKISGPAGGTISSSSTAVTTISALVAGVYQYQFSVTDNNGASGKDTINITVIPAPNQVPVANAGNNITLTLPVDSALLSGTGTDVDGTVVTYAWSKISGPAAGILNSANLPVASLSGLVQGVYAYQFIVTDNLGAMGRDTVWVTVNPAANLAPVANAGADVSITLPMNNSVLSGSATDADGYIVSYTWLKISGPGAGSINNAATAVTSVTGLQQGVYQFQLTVTDDAGAIARDTMQILVNAAPNQPPVANAGNDISITLPANSATLNGSGIDADGSIAAYAWRKISGPAAGNIVNAGSANASINSLVQGTYSFELTVTDNSAATAKDTMQVMVNAALNQAPIAFAGNNINITLPTNSITLNGSGTDADGSIASYAWRKIAGPAAGIITNPGNATTLVTSLVQGIYQFELLVTDNQGATGRDTLQVSVNPALNQAPVANAGIDIVLTLPVNTAVFNGTGTDADGIISGYSWIKISGPAAGTLTNANTPTPTANGLAIGVYQYQLTVTDNAGATGKDTLLVTVLARPNQAPTANAGTDVIITLPTNNSILQGSGTDTDGTITSYLWTKISGPAAGTITNAATSVTAVNGLVQGVYSFQLTVTDNAGAVGRDTMLLIVLARPNQAPTANAGADVNITLPTNNCILQGSGTDVDGTITGYLWTKISGPAAGTITNAATAVTSVYGLVQGIYLFQLTVTDNAGVMAKDTLQVVVNAAPNQVPIANAGQDIVINLPENTVILSGSGIDPDGNIVSYTWAKISGPVAGNITNAAAAITNVTGLVSGVYRFQLKVTDNRGGVGTDEIEITVNRAPNQAPTAFAGMDTSLYLPQDSVRLSGSGSDADGNIVAYKWRVLTTGGVYAFSNDAAAAPLFYNLQQGIYALELTVTDNDGASASDTLRVTVGSGRSYVSASVNVYPNPVMDMLYINLESGKPYNYVSIALFDSRGARVYDKAITMPYISRLEKISMTHLRKGMYTLCVNFGNVKQVSTKIIKP